MTTQRAWWQAWWGQPGWERFVHVAAAVTFVAAAAIFLRLASAAPEGTFLPQEMKIMQAMRRDGTPLGGDGTAAVVRDITALGSAAVLIIMILLVLGYLLMVGRLRVAALIAVATVGG